MNRAEHLTGDDAMTKEELQAWALKLSDALGLEPDKCQFEERIEVMASGTVIKHDFYASAWIEVAEIVCGTGETAHRALLAGIKNIGERIEFLAYTKSRQSKVSSVREQIANDTYETPEKLKVAGDRLLDDIVARNLIDAAMDVTHAPSINDEELPRFDEAFGK